MGEQNLLNYIRYLDTLENGRAFFEVARKGHVKTECAYLNELTEIERVALEHSYQNQGKKVDLLEVIYYTKLLKDALDKKNEENQRD